MYIYSREYHISIKEISTIENKEEIDPFLKDHYLIVRTVAYFSFLVRRTITTTYQRATIFYNKILTHSFLFLIGKNIL